MEGARKCPYCGVLLKHPYWAHVQSAHPEEYEKNETWITLFKDYSGMGMDKAICFMVIAELFNSSPEKVESFLKAKKII
ncbi:MAG: hypothetical protein ACFFBP_09695 [Promethearchaeota archaeon]